MFYEGSGHKGLHFRIGTFLPEVSDATFIQRF